MIDGALLWQVDPTWLAQQQRQGKLIVGLDIPFNELARLAEYPSGGAFLSSFGGRSFYSYLYDLGGCGIGQGGSGSDAIYSARSFPGFLRWLIERADCAARPTPFPQTGPARPRPTPTPTVTPTLRRSPGGYAPPGGEGSAAGWKQARFLPARLAR